MKKISFLYIGLWWHCCAVAAFILSIALRLMPTGWVRLYILLGLNGISAIFGLLWILQLKYDWGSKKDDD